MWEYITDAANVVGGLTQAQIGEMESLVARIADAVLAHGLTDSARATV